MAESDKITEASAACLTSDVNNNKIEAPSSAGKDDKANIKFHLNQDSDSSDDSEEHIYANGLGDAEKTSKKNNPVTGNLCSSIC